MLCWPVTPCAWCTSREGRCTELLHSNVICTAAPCTASTDHVWRCSFVGPRGDEPEPLKRLKREMGVALHEEDYAAAGALELTSL